MADLLKEKEEVQQYLKNLGIEYRYSCYGEKDPEGCQLLGDYFTQVTSEFDKANKVFKDNCDNKNFGRSCSSYGLHLFYGRGCDKNQPLALEYFSKGCDNNDATGCDYAGKILTNCEPSLSKDLQRDAQRGLRYLEHGCNLKSSSQMFESSESCYAAAFLYAVGLKGIGKDSDKAVQLGTRSCDLGQMKGCKLVSEVYAKEGNQQQADHFLKRFKSMQKQLTDGVELEMQRT